MPPSNAAPALALLARALLFALSVLVAGWTWAAPPVLGLDLEGGRELELALSPAADGLDAAEREVALEQALEGVRRRLWEVDPSASVYRRQGSLLVADPDSGGAFTVPRSASLALRPVRPGAPREPSLADLEATVVVGGGDIIEANIVQDETGLSAVEVELGPEAATRFSNYTASHVGERIAIVVDDNVVSAPMIRERIPGGALRVDVGSGGAEEAQELALALRAGSLPVPLVLVSETHIGGEWSWLGLPLFRALGALGVLLALVAGILPRRGWRAVAAGVVGMTGVVASLWMIDGTLTMAGALGAAVLGVVVSGSVGASSRMTAPASWAVAVVPVVGLSTVCVLMGAAVSGFWRGFAATVVWSSGGALLATVLGHGAGLGQGSESSAG